MKRSRREAGEGQFGCLFGLVLLAVALFIAYKVIPLKVKMADLRQVVSDEAKSAGSHNDELIRKSILAKADQNNLPVSDENISIKRTGNLITVDVTYVVPVEFPGYVYQWHQQHHAENPIF